MSSKNITVPGFPDVWGGSSRAVPVDHSGPTSYTTGGEVPFPQSTFGGPNSIGVNGVLWMSGGVTEDGLYYVVPVFGGGGAVKGNAKLKWFDLAASTGGTFAGTPAVLTGTNSAPTITTGTNATTTTPVYTNGGALTQVAGATGITGVQAPVLTMNSYTPAGTITGAAGGGLQEVANGTDLSGSFLRILVIGG
jgi:hypothetical protein